MKPVKENNYQAYVVGFLLRNNDNEVALIQKLTPAWQNGKLNGIGGKIENLETPYNAMVREFKEETGADVTDWKGMVALYYNEAEIYFFTSRAPVEIKSMEKEQVGWYDCNLFQYQDKIIPNLAWLIPLAQTEGDEFYGTILK